MSNNDQQFEELIALEAIYAEEYELLTKDGEFPPKLAISVVTMDNDPDMPDDTYSIKLGFLLPEKYPEVVPEIEIIEHSETVEDHHIEEALEMLHKMAIDSIGHVMIFDLVGQMHSWINELQIRNKTDREDAADRRRRELEESQQKKFVGTKVTVETFMKWKLAFEAELLELAKKRKIDDSKRPTGKEMFLSDKALANSDLQFGDDDDEPDVDATVDESLFADGDLDDLDPDFTVSDEDDD